MKNQNELFAIRAQAKMLNDRTNELISQIEIIVEDQREIDNDSYIMWLHSEIKKNTRALTKIFKMLG